MVKIIDIANERKVSRQTVYNWMKALGISKTLEIRGSHCVMVCSKEDAEALMGYAPPKPGRRPSR